MPQVKEFVPEGVKNYLRLIAAKLRYRDSFIGSPWIGRGVSLGRRCSISRGVELGAAVRIGDYSYINRGAIIGSGEIGRFCSVGPYSLVGLALHPTDQRSTSPLLYGPKNLLANPSDWKDFPEPPVIGSDVWMGASAFIRQGVRIGHGAVIGAGAVVTHDVPPYGIVAGVPARLIRRRFGPATIERLLESRWWELEISQLQSMGLQFGIPLEDQLPVPQTVFPVGSAAEDSR